MKLRQQWTTALRVGLGVLSAAATGSCTDWGDACYVYDCVRVYYPYYGYYLDCYPVRVPCESDAVCDEDGPRKPRRPRACKADMDCAPDEFCDATGICSRNASTPDAGSAPRDASVAVDASGLDATAGDAAMSSTGSQGNPPVVTPPSNDGAVSGGPAVPGPMSSGQRARRFNMPCQRDSQCGPGACKSGECFQACTVDEQCGTADRCSVESGRRICMPDPNPQVRCMQSSECAPGASCVDGACHAPCDVDSDCADPEDRCLHKLCFPDRRPVVECVLNLECAAGLMCLDGRCVDLSAR